MARRWDVIDQKRSSQQLSEQKRAARAWADIEEVPDTTEKTKYGSLARRLPALLQTNGLGQTLAFLRAKGGGDGRNHHNVIYDHLSGWVIEWVNGDGDLLEWILSESSDAYRRATTEAIAFAIWLRRFAEAKGWGKAQESE